MPFNVGTISRINGRSFGMFHFPSELLPRFALVERGWRINEHGVVITTVCRSWHSFTGFQPRQSRPNGIELYLRNLSRFDSGLIGPSYGRQFPFGQIIAVKTSGMREKDATVFEDLYRS